MTPVEFLFLAPNGVPVANAEVEIQLLQPTFDDQESGVLMPRLVTAITDSAGKVLVSLHVSPQPYQVAVYDPESEAGLSYKFYVPELTPPNTFVRLQDIIVDTEMPAQVPYDQAALLTIIEAKANAMSASTGAARSEDAAKLYMGQASGFADDASKSAAKVLGESQTAITARQGAEAAEGRTKTSESNAATSAGAAATSASNAAKSEGNAATSASNAAKSETNTKTSETNAKTSEGNAKASETNSKTSEGLALQYKGDALTQAGFAAGSATSANTSASNAATSANTANTFAGNAERQAIAANTSAGNAARSESNAGTSATNAKTSETNAAGSVTAAAAQVQIAKDWATKTGSPVDATNYSAKEYAAQSGSSALNAGQYAANAKTYSEDAVRQAGLAQGFANTADDLARDAVIAKTAAVTAAQLAQDWASKTTKVSGDLDSAKTYAAQAAASAAAASSSASAAVMGQVQANWNETDPNAKAFIVNKPTIPAAMVQIQSDWNQTDNTKPDFIKNKVAAAVQGAFTSGVVNSVAAQTNNRNVANPTTGLGYAGGVRFRFGTQNDIDTTAGYADIIDLSTYTDSSGGGFNALYFNKSSGKIVHKFAAPDATAWTTSRTLAYQDVVDLKATIASPVFTGNVKTSGKITANYNGFSSDTYAVNARNPIWRFENADTNGISYFQGSAGINSHDTFGIHFGTATAAGSAFSVNDSGWVTSTWYRSMASNGGSIFGSYNTEAGNAEQMRIYHSNNDVIMQNLRGSLYVKGTSDSATVATKLQTARTINGVAFDGSANIQLPTPVASADGTSVSIVGADLNNLTSTGFYRGQGMTNAPNSGWFYITHELHESGNWAKQTATTFGSGNVANYSWMRVRVAGTWTAWSKFAELDYGTDYTVKRRRNWYGNGTGVTLDNVTIPETGFSYASTEGSGITGPFIHFGGLGSQGDYGCQMVAEYSTGNTLKFRARNDDTAKTWNPWRTVWHDGNLTPSVNVTANSIVQRNGSGYVLGNYINMTDDSANGVGSTTTALAAVSAIICKRGDDYYRGQGAQPVKDFLGLGTFVNAVLPASTDLNNIKVPGVYGVQNNIANRPGNSGDYGTLFVGSHAARDTGTQIYTDYTASRMYMRSFGPSGWTSWVQLATSNDVTAAAGAVVLLGSATVSSAVAAIDFLTIFSAAYDQYRIEIINLGHDSSNYAYPKVTLAKNGAIDTSAVYSTLASNGNQYGSTSANTFILGDGNAGFASVSSSAMYGNADATITLNASQATNRVKTLFVNARIGNYVFAGNMLYAGANAVTGFRVNFSSGNIVTGVVRVYGIKNA